MVIKKVALAGATGNLGSAVLKKLLQHNFEIVVLTRGSNNVDYPSLVRVAIVDYGSVDSLSAALEGQDAVVSTLASAAARTQLLLVEAAQTANVKHFIPSEYGSDTTNPKTRQLPVYAEKVQVQDALERAARNSNLSYTLLMSGSFLDWAFEKATLINLHTKSVTLFDGGNRLFSTTTVEDIGEAVARVLEHPLETRNRAVYVNSAAISLKTLAELGKLAVGSEGWTETVVSADEMMSRAWAEFNKEKPDPQVLYKSFISIAMFVEGWGGHFEKTDNALLGISVKSEGELLSMLEESIRSGGTGR